MAASPLFVKNMVCHRCILAVAQILADLQLPLKQLLLGEVWLERDISDTEREQLRQRLSAIGFELIDDRKQQLIERIKLKVLEYLQNPRLENFSDFVTRDLPHDYAYLSSLFSSVEGITLEKYLIAQRIEKVKELLVYGEMSLAEIADQLGYSSSQYLSNQFRKVTGLTPGHFKQIGAVKRKPLDRV